MATSVAAPPPPSMMMPQPTPAVASYAQPPPQMMTPMTPAEVSEEVDEEPADIERGELLEAFYPLLKQKIDPDVLIDYLEQRAGLLVERKPRVWAFPHRSLQEYLAAWHVQGVAEKGA